VLACISVICVVLLLSNFLPFDRVRDEVAGWVEGELVAIGSMCTMS
jgi:hypothetical protein